MIPEILKLSMKNLINKWHTKLDMPKHDEAWHRADMEDELQEYHEARGVIDTWSELSDVVYTYTRALWSGHSTITFPFSKTYFFLGVLYMIPKYSLRWHFFRTLGKRIDPSLRITEVRNPKKIAKLYNIATQYNIDPTRFRTEAQKLMRWRIFFK